jgi:hypothetical protein
MKTCLGQESHSARDLLNRNFAVDAVKIVKLYVGLSRILIEKSPE